MAVSERVLSAMIFVFGSNLAGRHGKGAALYAKTNYGAEPGQGVGKQGRSYAIPTKDKDLNVLPLVEIEHYVAQFCRYAQNNPKEQFLLTPIGSGLAGHDKREIWKMLVKYNLPNNVFLASSWVTG
jgi:hypothetical protein